MKNVSEKHNPDIQAKTLPAPVARSFWAEKWSSCSKKLVLLDLDGTILDTAGDLGDAANQLRNRRGLDSLDIDLYRPEVSRGARGMIHVALNKNWTDPDFEQIRLEFLDAYYNNLLNQTDFIPGMEEFLSKLIDQSIKWGIVTNKYQKYAKPIIDGINLLNKHCSVWFVVILPTMPNHTLILFYTLANHLPLKERKPFTSAMIHETSKVDIMLGAGLTP